MGFFKLRDWRILGYFLTLVVVLSILGVLSAFWVLGGGFVWGKLWGLRVWFLAVIFLSVRVVEV